MYDDGEWESELRKYGSVHWGMVTAVEVYDQMILLGCEEVKAFLMWSLSFYFEVGLET